MFWKKKKEETVTLTKQAYEDLIAPKKPITPPPCPHTWVDFPWYLTHSWTPKDMCGNGESHLTIYEPYVCVHCQARKDIQLAHESETYISAKRHWDKKAKWEELYKDHLKPKAIVEDMINDAIMVDKGKIAIVAKLRGIEDEERKDKDSYRVGLALH